MKEYFIADTHFGHYNIIRYCNRPYSTVKEMNEKIIENWNRKVSPDDIVYFLGDFAFRLGRISLLKIRERLNGAIHLIVGNHDKKSTWIKDYFVTISKYKIIESHNMKILLAHHPVWKTDPYSILQEAGSYDLCLYGHSHNKISEDEPPNFICVSLENWNYEPVTLSEILERRGIDTATSNLA